jgi:REP element-mobilizing transposase RayT
MAQSFAKIAVHLVYSTKNRQPVLLEKIRKDIHSYTAGILKSLNCIPLAVNGTEDHIHILVLMSKNITLIKMVEAVKVGTSKWLKTKDMSLQQFSWQAGYGAFSVSESQIEKVIKYIMNQEQHHQKKSFQDELRILLQKHKMEFDEQYLWI